MNWRETTVTEATLPPTEAAPAVPPAAVPSAALDPLASIDGWDDEVKRCAAAHGLTDYLPAAVRIVLESFPPGSTLQMYVQREPEDGSRRVIIDARVMCGVSEAVEKHQRLLNRWTLELPIHVQTHATVTFCPA